jgi:hypothetical protein
MTLEPTTSFMGYVPGAPPIPCFRGDGRYQVGDLVATSLLGLRAKWLSDRLGCRGAWYRRESVIKLGWDRWEVEWIPVRGYGPRVQQTSKLWCCYAPPHFTSGLPYLVAPDLDALLSQYYHIFQVELGRDLCISLPREGVLHDRPGNPSHWLQQLMGRLQELGGTWLEPI